MGRYSVYHDHDDDEGSDNDDGYDDGNNNTKNNFSLRNNHGYSYNSNTTTTTGVLMMDDDDENDSSHYHPNENQLMIQDSYHHSNPTHDENYDSNHLFNERSRQYNQNVDSIRNRRNSNNNNRTTTFDSDYDQQQQQQQQNLGTMLFTNRPSCLRMRIPTNRNGTSSHTDIIARFEYRDNNNNDEFDHHHHHEYDHNNYYDQELYETTTTTTVDENDDVQQMRSKKNSILRNVFCCSCFGCRQPRRWFWVFGMSLLILIYSIWVQNYIKYGRFPFDQVLLLIPPGPPPPLLDGTTTIMGFDSNTITTTTKTTTTESTKHSNTVVDMITWDNYINNHCKQIYVSIIALTIQTPLYIGQWFFKSFVVGVNVNDDDDFFLLSYIKQQLATKLIKKFTTTTSIKYNNYDNNNKNNSSSSSGSWYDSLRTHFIYVKDYFVRLMQHPFSHHGTSSGTSTSSSSTTSSGSNMENKKKCHLQVRSQYELLESYIKEVIIGQDYGIHLFIENVLGWWGRYHPQQQDDEPRITRTTGTKFVPPLVLFLTGDVHTGKRSTVLELCKRILFDHCSTTRSMMKSPDTFYEEQHNSNQHNKDWDMNDDHYHHGEEHVPYGVLQLLGREWNIPVDDEYDDSCRDQNENENDNDEIIISTKNHDHNVEDNGDNNNNNNNDATTIRTIKTNQCSTKKFMVQLERLKQKLYETIVHFMVHEYHSNGAVILLTDLDLMNIHLSDWLIRELGSSSITTKTNNDMVVDDLIMSMSKSSNLYESQQHHQNEHQQQSPPTITPPPSSLPQQRMKLRSVCQNSIFVMTSSTIGVRSILHHVENQYYFNDPVHTNANNNEPKTTTTTLPPVLLSDIAYSLVAFYENVTTNVSYKAIVDTFNGFIPFVPITQYTLQTILTVRVMELSEQYNNKYHQKTNSMITSQQQPHYFRHLYITDIVCQKLLHYTRIDYIQRIPTNQQQQQQQQVGGASTNKKKRGYIFSANGVAVVHEQNSLIMNKIRAQIHRCIGYIHHRVMIDVGVDVAVADDTNKDNDNDDDFGNQIFISKNENHDHENNNHHQNNNNNKIAVLDYDEQRKEGIIKWCENPNDNDSYNSHVLNHLRHCNVICRYEL